MGSVFPAGNFQNSRSVVWVKSLKNFQARIYREFSGECKGMSGNFGGFPRENLPKGNVSGVVWGIIRKILWGMFLGKCMAVTFLGGYAIRDTQKWSDDY